MSTKKLGPRQVNAIGTGFIHCGFYDEVTDEQHNHYFANMEDYRQHLEDMPHLHVGNKKCDDCGTPNTPMKYYGTLHHEKLVPPTACDPCKVRRVKEAQGVSSL